MIRQFILYVLFGATLLPSISPLGTIAYFHLNRDYIARVLCENRDKPQLHCNGQCYLAKQLKKQQDKQDKETTKRVRNLPVLQWFCGHNLVFSFSASCRETLMHRLFSYSEAPYSASLAGLFRPPQLG